jgi:hypothetical protein
MLPFEISHVPESGGLSNQQRRRPAFRLRPLEAASLKRQNAIAATA